LWLLLLLRSAGNVWRALAAALVRLHASPGDAPAMQCSRRCPCALHAPSSAQHAAKRFAITAHLYPQDPLTKAADDIAEATCVICLDELSVTDVADAMILNRLFGRLWDRSVVLVATSNRAPNSLYENGLQRPLFVPFIHRLEKECVVHYMDSALDYRTLATRTVGLYFVRLVDGHTKDERLAGALEAVRSAVFCLAAPWCRCLHV
jgi:predicted ATPase